LGFAADLGELRVLGDGTTLVAVGSNGAISRSTDGGETRSARDSQVEARLRELGVLGDGTPATFAALYKALAAYKVEFGRGSTPSDQAVEIAKAIVSRRSN
jgi:hypothetical protein